MEKIPFNAWSRERIEQGRKLCISRTRRWNDSRVEFVIQAPLWFIKKYFWQLEGANSPEEFERVITQILGKFEPERIMYVHFGNFKEKRQRSEK